MNSSYAFPLSKAFSDELTNHVKEQGYGWKHMHSFELVAAFHGFKSEAARKASGFLAGARYPASEVSLHENLARDRAIQLRIEPEAADVAIDKLYELCRDELNPSVSLAKRIERNVAYNCDMHPEWGYIGSVLLDEADWRACGDIASSDSFTDYLYTPSPYSAISVISSAYPDPAYEGLYQVNPDAVMNIAAFLRIK